MREHAAEHQTVRSNLKAQTVFTCYRWLTDLCTFTNDVPGNGKFSFLNIIVEFICRVGPS